MESWHQELGPESCESWDQRVGTGESFDRRAGTRELGPGVGTGIRWRWDKTVRTGELGPKTWDQELGQDSWESWDQRVRRVGTRSWDQRVARVGTRELGELAPGVGTRELRELGPESWDRRKF